MRTRTPRTSHGLVIAATAALIGLAASACHADAQSAAPAPATSRQTTLAPATLAPASNGTADVPAVSPSKSSPTRTTGTTGKSGITGPLNAVGTEKLKFPNTSVDVVFTKYDAKNKLVEFQKVVQDPKSPTAHLVPDPRDPAIHELPMASGATVKSIVPGGFPFETCPPTSCTIDNVMESVIGHFYDAFYAHIHVDAADQIDSVAQSAY
jgi:hypothetical protein